MQAVDGIVISGVSVQTIIISSCSAVMPAISMACLAAIVHISDVLTPSGAKCRSRIPVRSRIHSSDVSTIFSKSAFVTTLSGT